MAAAASLFSELTTAAPFSNDANEAEAFTYISFQPQYGLGHSQHGASTEATREGSSVLASILQEQLVEALGLIVLSQTLGGEAEKQRGRENLQEHEPLKKFPRLCNVDLVRNEESGRFGYQFAVDILQAAPDVPKSTVKADQGKRYDMSKFPHHQFVMERFPLHEHVLESIISFLHTRKRERFAMLYANSTATATASAKSAAATSPNVTSNEKQEPVAPSQENTYVPQTEDLSTLSDEELLKLSDQLSSMFHEKTAKKEAEPASKIINPESETYQPPWILYQLSDTYTRYIVYQVYEHFS